MARMGRQFTARAAALIAASVCLAVGLAAGGNGPDGQPAERPFLTRAEFESFAGPRAVSSAEREAVVRGAWVEGRVPRVEWDPETPFLAVVASLGIPVLIRNSVVTTWPALERWTPSRLAERLETMPYVELPTDPTNVRYYAGGRPLSANKDIFDPPVGNFEATPHVRNMAARDFFAALESSSSAAGGDDLPPPPFYYARIDKLPPLINDVGNLTALYNAFRTAQEAVAEAATGEVPDGVKVSNWFGTAPHTTPTHYDESHNCYVQVHGRKRFFLAPPSAAAHLRLYPTLHAYPRQSQVNPIQGTTVDVTGLDPATRCPPGETWCWDSVDLEPGDLLYLPPFWFHQVTALTTSLSVNVWTTSGDGRLLDAIVDYQLPMNAAWRGSKRERALTTVMHLLVAGGVGNGPEWQGGTAGDDSLTGDAELHAEVAGRYVVLFGDDGLRSLSGGSGSGSRRRSRCRARNKSEENAFRARFAATVDELVALFGELSSPAVAQTALGDFAEAQAVVHLGIAATPSFVVRCLGAVAL